jgi:hypothetical protein
MIPILLSLIFGRRPRASRGDDALLRQMLAQSAAPPPPYYSGVPYPYGYPPPPARRGVSFDGLVRALLNLVALAVLALIGYQIWSGGALTAPAASLLGEAQRQVTVRPPPPAAAPQRAPAPAPAPQPQAAPAAPPAPAVIESEPGVVEAAETWPGPLPTAEILPPPPQPAVVTVVEPPPVYAMPTTGALYTPVPAPTLPPLPTPPPPVPATEYQVVTVSAGPSATKQCVVYEGARICDLAGGIDQTKAELYAGYIQSGLVPGEPHNPAEVAP